jgi:hypothetical protein
VSVGDDNNVAEPSENDETEWKALPIKDTTKQTLLDTCKEEMHRALEVADIPGQTPLDVSQDVADVSE